VLFHVAVVLEERDIVSGAFDAGDQGEIVIELDASGAHKVVPGFETAP
jgi:hypothetical protein